MYRVEEASDAIPPSIHRRRGCVCCATCVTVWGRLKVLSCGLFSTPSSTEVDLDEMYHNHVNRRCADVRLILTSSHFQVELADKDHKHYPENVHNFKFLRFIRGYKNDIPDAAEAYRVSLCLYTSRVDDVICAVSGCRLCPSLPRFLSPNVFISNARHTHARAYKAFLTLRKEKNVDVRKKAHCSTALHRKLQHWPCKKIAVGFFCSNTGPLYQLVTRC